MSEEASAEAAAVPRSRRYVPYKPPPKPQFILDPQIVEKVKNLPAHKWHDNRRMLLLQKPEVKQLIKNGAGHLLLERAIVHSVMVAVFLTHFSLAIFLDGYAKSASFGMGACAVIVSAATVGAHCAYVVQATCHECAHGLQRSSLVMYLFGALLGSAGSALCHIPWAVYYFAGGHPRHHLNAGSRRDVDGDALFWMWEWPQGGPVKRFFWLSTAAMIVPLVFYFSLGYLAYYDPRANIKELSCVSLDLACTVVLHYMVGYYGAAYLLLSSFFSMGFLCHPLIAFWLIQHKCVGVSQPTMSYYGSSVWNFLCLNELYHVEHHDFACVSWRHLPKLRDIAPEFYSGLQAEHSLFSMIKNFLTEETASRKLYTEWDFGCRLKAHFDLTQRAMLLTHLQNEAAMLEARKKNH